MIDILFINVPQISLVYPPAATSLLKGICEHHGYTAKVKDYNLQLYDQCQDACIAQEHKTGLDQVTLNQHFNEFAETLFDSWLAHQIIVNKKIYKDFRTDLKKYQITALKKYFNYTISDNGLVFIKSESK